MKKILALLAALLLLAVACGDDEPAVDAQTAAALNTKAYLAASTAMGEAYADATQPTGSYTFNYNQNGITVTGDITYNEGTGWGEYTATIAFNNYTATDTVLNGSATITFSGDSSAFNYQYRGSFSATYQGTTYTLGWKLDIGFSGTGYSYSGSYTVNGQTFSYSASGQG